MKRSASQGYVFTRSRGGLLSICRKCNEIRLGEQQALGIISMFDHMHDVRMEEVGVFVAAADGRARFFEPAYMNANLQPAASK